MQHLQRAGGIAALVEAGIYVVGFVGMVAWLNPGDTSAWSAVQKLEFVLARKALFQAWMFLLYVAGGMTLAVLVAALHVRLKSLAPATMAVATGLGWIWSGLVIASGMVASVGVDTVAALHAVDPAQAATVWIAIGAVQNGLGGGVEVLGGVWVLLVSTAAWRSRMGPRALHGVGLIVGMAGTITLVPSWAEALAAVFGLGQIAWFLWLGTCLLRERVDMPGFDAVSAHRAA